MSAKGKLRVQNINRSVMPFNKEYFSVSAWLLPVILAVFLITISLFNFLLFHTFAELFAITIAVLMGIVIWNTYPFTRNNFLMYLGCGYFWIGVLDLLHAFSYEGMNVIPGSDGNMGVQFWIGTRYIEALLLLSAPWFLNHTFNRVKGFIFFGGIAAAIVTLIYLELFPVVYIDGQGLTPFKIYSEYIIILLLASSIYYLYKQKSLLDERIINVMIVSIILTMCAELAFTFYVSVHGLSNLIGHIFKLFSFWLIFQAIIRTTLQEPFLVMSQGATTYDAIPDATIVVDDHGIIRQVNNEACLLSHMGRNELIGKNNHEVFHSENTNSDNCHVCNAIVSHDELKGYEMEINNTGHWYDFSLSKITNSSSINGTVEVIRDITKRKLAEVKFDDLDILKNSIVENLPSMLFVKDAADHRYVEWNKAAEELTGILKGDILGNNDFDFWPKEQAQAFVENDKEVIESGHQFDIAEEQITTRRKGTRTVHTKKIPIFDEKGKAKYLLGISEDITEKIQTEKILNRSQKMEAVGQMSGGIAHDFNNQLGIILGYTDLMSEQDLNDTQYEWLQMVRNAAQRCADLTKQLLIFSRNGDVEKNIVEINSLISSMKTVIERTLTPEVNVEYYLGNDIWDVEINSGSFQDVIINLVINARDAMPDGGSLIIETANINLNNENIHLYSALKPGEYIQIMVSDTGHGMDTDVADHIFEPFYTTKDVGKGTGLGLSMVYGFVQRFNGEILLDTKPDKGTTFKIYLPRAINKDAALIEQSPEDKVYSKGHEKILVVDDEEALLIFAEEVLKSWGYEVFSAKNADDALIILEKSPIDLLFTDVVMPGDINGYKLAEMAVKKNSKLKVLITSGFAEKFGDSKKYANYGFELISKPYDRGDLAEKLRQLLDE